jgi:hypothetical protein
MIVSTSPKADSFCGRRTGGAWRSSGTRTLRKHMRLCTLQRAAMGVLRMFSQCSALSEGSPCALNDPLSAHTQCWPDLCLIHSVVHRPAVLWTDWRFVCNASILSGDRRSDLQPKCCNVNQKMYKCCLFGTEPNHHAYGARYKTPYMHVRTDAQI